MHVDVMSGTGPQGSGWANTKELQSDNNRTNIIRQATVSMIVRTDLNEQLKRLSKGDSISPFVKAIILIGQVRKGDFKGFYSSVMIQKYKQFRHEDILSALYSLPGGLFVYKHARSYLISS